MKKLFTFIFALAFASAAFLTTAHASGGTVSFNNDPRDLPTVTVSDYNTNKCNAGPADGCWKTSITANAGDLVSVQVYFHNTGTAVSTETAVGISPKNSGSSTSHTFSGVVAGGTDTSGNVIVRGSATVNTPGGESLEFIPGSLRYYPDQSTGGYTLSGESYLFSSTGINIGDVKPGWSGQGVLVADFRVSGSSNPGNNCSITDFHPNPGTINYGGTSTLTWSTTGCQYVNISSVGNNLSPNSSTPVSPGSTRTYTLTAYPGGDTRQVTVYVNGNNNNNACYINYFNVDTNSIVQGQTTTLHWSTTGATSVNITGFGTQGPDGNLSISPFNSTTYTLTLNGYNCGGASQSVSVSVGQQNNNVQQPQAITTVASVLNSYAAQLNGIAVPNSSYSASAWFEYGSTTSLGNRTDAQNVTGAGTYPYSANISGLAPNHTYYYRAVVQNQAGIAYGSVVPFSTPGSAVYVPPTKTVYVQSQTTSRSTGVRVTGNSQPSLFKLEVVSNADHMCIGGNISYTVNYQNISTQVLQNSVLQITFPGEVTYVSASQGSYDVTTRTLTIPLGDVQPGQMGSVTVNAQVNDQATVGKLEVITATMVYTNPTTHAQEQAIAYSLITVSNDCPSVLGASVFGLGGFLPTTLLGWLLLILIILALIVLARTLYHKKEEKA